MRAALLLDLDGTIADSLPVMRRTYELLLAEHGRQGSEDEFNRLNGPPLSIVAGRLIEGHGLAVSPEALVSRYRALIAEAYLAVAPRPEALPLLQTAAMSGAGIGIVTSNSSAQAQQWLSSTGLATFIEVIIGAEDAAAGKPDPAPYREALVRLGADPQQSLAVEDTLTGARAAVGAGLMTAVLDHAPEQLEAGMLAIGSLSDVPPILRRLGRGLDA